MKFKPLDYDIDRHVAQAQIIGRLTPNRYKIIERWVRAKSIHHGHCGHEWDCCGCLVNIRYAVNFERLLGSNLFKITITSTANYNY